MPPAALAIITGLPAARSSTRLRYSSRVICRPSSISDAADDAALGAGLMRDERHAEHVARDALGFVGRPGELDAAALAAAAGVNLRLDDDHAAAETLGDLARVGGGGRISSPRGTGTPWRARMALA